MANVVLIEPTPVKPPLKFHSQRIPPLAPLTVAAPLLGDGYSVEIIDQRLNANWERSLLSAIDDDTLCVGISTLTGHQLLYALEASRVVKQHTSVPVVWGGVHASLLPEQTVRHPLIDYVVEGEGDHTLLALVRALAEGRDGLDVPGVWAKRDGSVRATPPGQFLDMDTLPRIPFHLIDAATYGLAEALPMFTSRGCAHRCGFCYNVRYFSRRWRAMQPERVLEDLRHYVDTYKPRKILFWDSNFFQDFRRAREICEGIVSQGLRFRWRASCRIDYLCRMTDDYIDLLLQSGFEDFRIGIESGSQRVLDLIGMDFGMEEVREAVRRLRALGLPYYGAFLGGYPGETLEELEETLRFIARLFREDPSFVFALRPYIPRPGTAAYDQLHEQGFQFPDGVEGWANFNFPCHPAISGVGKRHSFYTLDTPWLSPPHKRRLLQAHFLTQVAGRPLFRSRSPLMRFLALPHDLTIRFARWRWAHGWWGPVPERHLYALAHKVGRPLYRKLRGRAPTQGLES